MGLYGGLLPPLQVPVARRKKYTARLVANVDKRSISIAQKDGANSPEITTKVLYQQYNENAGYRQVANSVLDRLSHRHHGRNQPPVYSSLAPITSRRKYCPSIQRQPGMLRASNEGGISNVALQGVEAFAEGGDYKAQFQDIYNPLANLNLWTPAGPLSQMQSLVHKKLKKPKKRTLQLKYGFKDHEDPTTHVRNANLIFARTTILCPMYWRFSLHLRLGAEKAV